MKLLVVLLYCLISGSKSQRFQPSTCVTPTNDFGRCIYVFDCQPMMKILNRTLSDEMKMELQKYFCGTDRDGVTSRVCCPDKDIVLQSEDDPLFPTKNCGESEALIRITNGEKANLLEFPWQAALKYVSRYAISYSCGGSLINKRYVLTAAHCITSTLIGVRLGEHDFLTTIDCIKIRNNTLCAPPPQDFDITRSDVTIHSNYVRATSGYDIALIRLPKNAIFNNAVKAICLPINQDLTPRFLTNLFVAGWGRTERGTFSSILLKASIPYQQNEYCNRLLPVRVYDTQLCAGKIDGKDTCKGDSGSPIMTAVNVDGRIKTVQVGLVSFGPIRCGQDYPGIYTRLTSYIRWISDNIKP